MWFFGFYLKGGMMVFLIIGFEKYKILLILIIFLF